MQLSRRADEHGVFANHRQTLQHRPKKFTYAPVDTSAPIQKLVRLSAKIGRESELLNALRLVEAETLKEPGCIEFTLLQALSKPSSFVLLEHFSNHASFDAHMEMPHTKSLFAARLVAAAVANDVPTLGSPAASAGAT